MNTITNNNLNIFLTDDDLDDCMFFSDTLKELNKNSVLTITNDGVALMDILDITVPPPPYVIFLNLNMPRKNGFECLKEIRQSTNLRNILVVFIYNFKKKNFGSIL